MTNDLQAVRYPCSEAPLTRPLAADIWLSVMLTLAAFLLAFQIAGIAGMGQMGSAWAYATAVFFGIADYCAYSYVRSNWFE